MIVKKNKVQCRKCSDVIESISVHDFRECKCGAIFTDGGFDYIRRGGELENMIEINEEGDARSYSFIMGEEYFYATNDHCQGVRADGDPAEGEVPGTFQIPTRVGRNFERVLWTPEELIEVFMKGQMEIPNPVKKYIPDWRKNDKGSFNYEVLTSRANRIMSTLEVDH